MARMVQLQRAPCLVSSYNIDEEAARAPGEGVFAWLQHHRDTCGAAWETATPLTVHQIYRGPSDSAGWCACVCLARIVWRFDPEAETFVATQTVGGRS
jgi:hypothetical protein